MLTGTVGPGDGPDGWSEVKDTVRSTYDRRGTHERNGSRSDGRRRCNPRLGRSGRRFVTFITVTWCAVTLPPRRPRGLDRRSPGPRTAALRARVSPGVDRTRPQ